MPIVSSVLAQQAIQADGRKQVVEIHTDDLGVEYRRECLADVGADLQAALTAHATQLAADLAAGELAANVAAILGNGSLAVLAFLWSTAGQLRTALRAAYVTATRLEAIMLGDFLSTLTDGQLQTAFSLTAGQVTTLRTNKLTPAANAAATIRAAAGQ